MGKTEQCPGSAALEPEDDVRPVPLVAGLAPPIRKDRRLTHYEPEAVDSGTVEEAQFNGASGLSHVRRPPLAEAASRREQGVDGFRFRHNLNRVVNICCMCEPSREDFTLFFHIQGTIYRLSYSGPAWRTTTSQMDESNSRRQSVHGFSECQLAGRIGDSAPRRRAMQEPLLR